MAGVDSGSGFCSSFAVSTAEAAERGLGASFLSMYLHAELHTLQPKPLHAACMTRSHIPYGLLYNCALLQEVWP